MENNEFFTAPLKLEFPCIKENGRFYSLDKSKIYPSCNWYQKFIREDENIYETLPIEELNYIRQTLKEEDLYKYTVKDIVKLLAKHHGIL